MSTAAAAAKWPIRLNDSCELGPPGYDLPATGSEPDHRPVGAPGLPATSRD